MYNNFFSSKSYVRRSNWSVRTMRVCDCGFDLTRNAHVCPPHPIFISDHYPYCIGSRVLQYLYSRIRKSWASNRHNARRRYVCLRSEHIPWRCSIFPTIYSCIVQQWLRILSCSWTSAIHHPDGTFGTILEKGFHGLSLLSSLDLCCVVGTTR